MHIPGLRFQTFRAALLVMAAWPLSAQDVRQAEQRACRLSQNPSDPYRSVPAFREYCRDLAITRGQQDE